MSKDPFPEHADVNKLFARNGAISAVLPLERCARLAAALNGPEQGSDGQTEVSLQFGHDDEGRRQLRGTLASRVWQQCQRCLQPMQLELHCDLDVLVLDSEQELHELPDADAVTRDVIVDETGELDLLALIEDELLLSLPLVPMHEDAGCSTVMNEFRQKAGSGTAGGNSGSGRPNPFAVLAALKQDNNGSDKP